MKMGSITLKIHKEKQKTLEIQGFSPESSGEYRGGKLSAYDFLQWVPSFGLQMKSQNDVLAGGLHPKVFERSAE